MTICNAQAVKYLFVHIWDAFGVRHVSSWVRFLSAKIQTQSYAFFAHDLSSSSTPSVGDTLVFRKTLLNEGGVYSTTTGKFTAPCDGVYEFHATVTSNQSKKCIYVEFKAGDVAIGRIEVCDYYYHISNSGSAMAKLRKGTEVYMRVTHVNPGFRFLEDAHRMKTFSGHLISH